MKEWQKEVVIVQSVYHFNLRKMMCASVVAVVYHYDTAAVFAQIKLIFLLKISVVVLRIKKGKDEEAKEVAGKVAGVKKCNWSSLSAAVDHEH